MDGTGDVLESVTSDEVATLESPPLCLLTPTWNMEMFLEKKNSFYNKNQMAIYSWADLLLLMWPVGHPETRASGEGSVAIK